MCDACGCGDSSVVSVDARERMLASNDQAASHNRALFDECGLRAIHVMGSPGAGKTAVLEATARALGRSRRRLGALLATDRDAERLERAGILARSITTGTVCHLDADMVHRALHHLPWKNFEYLFIENVGNLVCPALHDVGHHVNVVVLSVMEGEDKPLTYHIMFRKADLVLLTKIDLLPYLDVSIDRIADALARVMPKPAMLPLSARTGAGLDRWLAWLERPTRGGGRRCAEAAGTP
ncbi:MAG: hydrogenase nickel incorporation protein HypB [Acidobacteria bacterium]|nr:hydrogenase nickel incorporation protein HypB [Acidobacteriota bacterium]